MNQKLDFKVFTTAGEILNHDINPDDYYDVEEFFRQQNRKVSNRFIRECWQEARRQRDNDRTHALAHHLFSKVGSSGETSENFKHSTAEDVAAELRRLAAANKIEWHSNNATEINAAYLTTLLLIECIAWHRHDVEVDASWNAMTTDEKLAEEKEGKRSDPKSDRSI
jgi:hypothetical protein